MKPSQLLRSSVGLPFAQGFYAYDKAGNRCGAHSLQAETFCTLGRVYNTGAAITPADDRITAENMAIAALEKAVGERGVADWNDASGRTMEEVDALCIKAAEYLEAQGN
jgi:hypothetical protein